MPGDELARDNLLKQHKKHNQTLAQIQNDKDNIEPMVQDAEDAISCIDIQSINEIKNMKFLSPTQEVVDTLSLVQTIYNNARYEDQSWAKTQEMLDDPELSLQFFNEEIKNQRIQDETIQQTEQQIEELEF